MTIKEVIHACLTEHKGKSIGLSSGLAFGILVLTLGFWRAFFLGLCLALGGVLGSFYDRRVNFLAFLDKILPNLLNK